MAVRRAAQTIVGIAAIWTVACPEPGGARVPPPKIPFGAPALAPFVHTLFCVRYPAECAPRRPIFRGGAVALTDGRRSEIAEVNAAVNRSIAPQRNDDALAPWLLSPKAGNCTAYAVTKRHELAKRGWPLRTLLLAEVVVGSGEHHLVLVIRTREGDLVADNLSPAVKSWSKTPYRWIRIQSPKTPVSWSTVGGAAPTSAARAE